MADQEFVAAQQRGALEPMSYAALAGWTADDALAAWRCLERGLPHILADRPVLREAVKPGPALLAALRTMAQDPPTDSDQARRRFEAMFVPCRITPTPGRNPYDHGFLTGYYEPVIAGSLERSAEFSEPVLSRPAGLETIGAGGAPVPPGFPEGLSSLLRKPDGAAVPLPTRAQIEAGALGDLSRPVIWLRDAIEVFMAQVQGSARIRLPDGRLMRMVYDGRNGHPYTSIGRHLVETGAIAAPEMSLATLKAWVRMAGQAPGEPGRVLLHRNKSYVFFRLEPLAAPQDGPTGGAGAPLTTLRSIAVDRTLWPYGIPFWIHARLPWRSAQDEPFQRLMIAQDTGSAILGVARADLYFGSGDAAGALAGSVRHAATMFALLPRAAVEARGAP